MKNVGLLLICLSLVLSTSLFARTKYKQGIEKPAKNCELISNQDAREKAEAKSGGKVVSIKLEQKGDSSVYKVRVIVDDKRVKNLTIKACK